jgi:hypothetical protein
MSFINYTLKVGINILNDDYFNNKLDFYDYIDISKMPDSYDLYIVILIDHKVSLIKVFNKNNNYFNNKEINKFLYNDNKLIYNTKCNCLTFNESIQFKKNKLIFSSMFVGGFKSLINVVYELDKFQLIQFKEEFKKLKIFNE